MTSCFPPIKQHINYTVDSHDILEFLRHDVLVLNSSIIESELLIPHTLLE